MVPTNFSKRPSFKWKSALNAVVRGSITDKFMWISFWCFYFNMRKSHLSIQLNRKIHFHSRRHIAWKKRQKSDLVIGEQPSHITHFTYYFCFAATFFGFYVDCGIVSFFSFTPKSQTQTSHQFFCSLRWLRLI